MPACVHIFYDVVVEYNVASSLYAIRILNIIIFITQLYVWWFKYIIVIKDIQMWEIAQRLHSHKLNNNNIVI